jgi:hypothetical protein
MTKMTRIDGVECYGEVRDNSNFYIICEDEEFDGIWADNTFGSWTEVVSHLKAHYRKDIIEIQEC